MPEVSNRLRTLRQQRGLTQQELARRAGVTRQTIAGIESGRYLPTVGVALRLARVLGCRVEDLFTLEEAEPPLRAVTTTPLAHPGRRRRVTLAEVRGTWRAFPADGGWGMGLLPADGVLIDDRPPRGRDVWVQRLRPLAHLRDRVVVAGCDPALGLLAALLAERAAPVRLCWLNVGSHRALDMLRAHEVHLAGIHLWDERTGSYNLPAVRQAFPQGGVVLIHLAQWEQGFVVAPGNPLAIRRVGDLLRPPVRMINREPGSGARALLDRLLKREGIDPASVQGYGRTLESHLAVAQAVAWGAADVGVSTRFAAELYGLDFLPLSLERFDLVIPADSLRDPRVESLVDALCSGEFRRQLAATAGYGTSEIGRTTVLTKDSL